jgi:hypothetical protein
MVARSIHGSAFVAERIKPYVGDGLQASAAEKNWRSIHIVDRVVVRPEPVTARSK